MSTFHVEIFEQTENSAKLRLFNSQRDLEDERALDRGSLEKLLDQSEIFYSSNRPDIASLGSAIYQWLDGAASGWLARLQHEDGPISLYLTVDQKLRHVPWELLANNGEFLCVHPVHPIIPIRVVSLRTEEQSPKNRALRVLFMAASPIDVKPVLAFEVEEAKILAETRKAGIEFIVEESGTLEGLQEWIDRFPDGDIDVVHLTGHAEIRGGRPVFVAENDKGHAQAVTADEIARVFGNSGRFPRLLFLSGCRTGQSLEQGGVPSLCEALLKAGIPAVLGWALPVGDQSATLAAAELYDRLGHGVPLHRAVARVRESLYSQDSPFWPLLRLYSSTPPSALVTPVGQANRAKLQQINVRQRFLDAQGKIEVCSRERFVGRRRELQQALRTLTASPGEDDYAEGILIHGIGGLGKSSFAARLCDRLAPTHRPWVWVGRFDEVSFRQVVNEELATAAGLTELNGKRLPLRAWLEVVLTELLGNYSVIFVFDDFEQNLVLGDDGAEWTHADAQKCLQELLTVLHRLNSESKVLLTSRYVPPLTNEKWLRRISLTSLHAGDQRKVVEALPNLSPRSGVPEDLRERAIDLAAGNPRLLARMDKTLGVSTLDHPSLLSELLAVHEEFREELLIRKLLAILDVSSLKLLARLAIHNAPFTKEVLERHMSGDIDESEFFPNMASFNLSYASIPDYEPLPPLDFKWEDEDEKPRTFLHRFAGWLSDSASRVFNRRGE